MDLNPDISHSFEGSLFDVHDVVLLGGGLERDIADILPIRQRLAVRGDVILGENITGYAVVLGVAL